MFNAYSDRYGTNYAGNVWSRNGVSPAVLTMGGGNRQPMIVEIYEERDNCERRHRQSVEGDKGTILQEQPAQP